MSEVTPIRPVESKVDEELVQALEGLLADAKAGQVVGVTAAIQYQGRRAETLVRGEFDGGAALWLMECWKARLLKLKGVL